MSIDANQNVNAEVRDVTPEEIALFEKNGWVMLRGLISRELATEMLRSAVSHRSLSQEHQMENAGVLMGAGVEPFRSFTLGSQMAQNAQALSNQARLRGTQAPMRFHHGYVWHKDSSAPGTPYHQDATEEGADRSGQVVLWLALDEVTPEMGAMRFVTGAHREGPLGIHMEDGEPDLLKFYPKLLDVYELSPPFHYQPGDATVHTGYTPHGGPPNTTARPRCSYIFGYMPADTRYINGNAIRPGVERREASDDDYPLVTVG